MSHSHSSTNNASSSRKSSKSKHDDKLSSASKTLPPTTSTTATAINFVPLSSHPNIVYNKSSSGDGKKSNHKEGKNKESKDNRDGSSSSPIARDPSPYKTRTNAAGDTCVIVDVWARNLHDELAKIMDIVDDYNYIAMDTEFPGVVARPLGCFKNAHDYHYQTLKVNVDLLKLIQLGLTFCNAHGRFLPGTCAWQFNFKFNLSEDTFAQDSIDMLQKSGISFSEHDQNGIDVEEFGEVLMTSGVVLNDDVRWMSFHSGYDFGYLLKVLTCTPLPKEETDFFELLRIYFPHIYDVKYLIKSVEQLKGGLQKVAEDLQIDRIGPQHQAGSDSLLTAGTFFKIRSLFFENQIDDSKYEGVLYGLGQNNFHKSSKGEHKVRKESEDSDVQ